MKHTVMSFELKNYYLKLITHKLITLELQSSVLILGRKRLTTTAGLTSIGVSKLKTAADHGITEV